MEENKDYHAYRYGDHLTPGSELKIEHSVVCENVDGPHLAVHIAAAPCPVLVNSVDGDALLHTARHLAAAVGSLGGRILT